LSDKFRRWLYASMRRYGSWIWLLALTLSPLPFFWPVLARRASFATGDFLLQYYPYHRFVSDQLWQGRLPLWNPFVYCGAPGLADPQLATFYPPSLLTSILAGRHGLPVIALEAEAIVHFCLVALFMYLFLNRLLGAWFPASVGALTFTFGGFLTSYPPQQLAILETSVWLPLLLLLIDLAITQSLRYVSPIAIGFAVTIAAGHPQTVLYIGYACLLFAAWRAFSKRAPRDALVSFAGVGAALFLGLPLAAVQVVPTVELAPLTARAALGYEAVSGGLSGWQQIAALIMPRSLGDPAVYVGIVPLFLIPYGLVLESSKDRFFWLGLAVLSFLAALGDVGPLYPLLYRLAPGFSLVRNQERALFLFSFALAVLTAHGAKALLSSRSGRWGKQVGRIAVLCTLPVILVLLALISGRFRNVVATHQVEFLRLIAIAVASWLIVLIIALLGRRRPPVLQWLLVLLVLIDLHLNSAMHKWSRPLMQTYPIWQVVRFIWADERRPFRISSEGLLPGDGNAGIIYGLEDVAGNSPMQLGRNRDLAESVEDEWALWRLSNVKYALTTRYMERSGIVLSHQEDGLYLYLVSGGLPRAFLVYNVWRVDEPSEALRLLNRADYEPGLVAVIEAPPGARLYGQPAFRDLPVEVEVEMLSPTHLRLFPQSETEAFLVLSQPYYAGWRALVDGVEKPLIRTNYAFSGLFLPPGSHEVDFMKASRWIPPSLLGGGSGLAEGESPVALSSKVL